MTAKEVLDYIEEHSIRDVDKDEICTPVKYWKILEKKINGK